MSQITYDLIDGKFSNVKVDGKPVQKSYANALEYAQTGIVGKMKTVNPMCKRIWYTCDGAVVRGIELNALQASIYNWVMRWQAYNPYPTPVAYFDGMRYLFLALDANAYMNILD